MLFHGHALLLAGRDLAFRARRSGFFFRRTRFLSTLELRVAGQRASMASFAPLAADRLMAHGLARLPRGRAGGPPNDGDHEGEIVAHGIELELDVRLTPSLEISVNAHNHGLTETDCELAWLVDADFADQDELRSGEAETDPVEHAWQGDDLVICSPELGHIASIRLSAPGARLFHADRTLACVFRLAPQARRQVRLCVEPRFEGAALDRDGEDAFRRARRDWLDGCASLTCDTPRVAGAFARAARDLHDLQLGEGDGDERFTPAAGAPNYIALFGRDALMAGWQSLLLNPSTLAGVVDLMARWSAKTYDRARDAQPGKILHQRQLSPSALEGRTPFSRYYGDHSAPGLFLIGVAASFARSGDASRFRALRDQALRTLEWMDRDGDPDGDGFYEYQTKARHGLKNQGWKDSRDAILYPDGRLVRDPIAVCEIQGLYYAAKRSMAAAFRAAGEGVAADDLDASADRLRDAFDRAFWIDDLRSFALALDGDKQPVRTAASNPGACLAYGLVAPAKAADLVRRLMAEDMFSGWGVRTLSTGHPAYNPLAYHLGSVWPSPNALLARGLRRYGQDEAFDRLCGALFDAAGLFEGQRLPELFGGHARQDDAVAPGLYPEACAPQAWSAGAIILLVDTIVGLKPAAPEGQVYLDPHLPSWMSELSLHGVKAGQGHIDLRLRRGERGNLLVEVARNTTGLELIGPAADGGAPASPPAGSLAAVLP